MSGFKHRGQDSIVKNPTVQSRLKMRVKSINITHASAQHDHVRIHDVDNGRETAGQLLRVERDGDLAGVIATLRTAGNLLRCSWRDSGAIPVLANAGTDPGMSPLQASST